MAFVNVACLILVLACFGLGSSSKTQKQKTDGKPAPKEGDLCEPTDERWYPVADDQSAFLFCEVARKKLKLHRCNTNDELFKVFDPKRQQCVVAKEEYRWLLMAPPIGVPTKRVGDTCVVNRDCSDGMYCNAGICSCYLNYIEINLSCVRVTSVCQGTTFYPEQINGKPKICSTNSPCPPGYICRPENGGAVGANVNGQEHGFCCMATGNEVCGQSPAHLVNGHPVVCYYPNATESCPSGHVCQLHQAANRHYCCQSASKTPEPVLNGSTPAPPPASTKARHVQHPDSFCLNGALAYLYDGYPIVCNPNNTASCPKDFPCQKNEKINLHFCCQNNMNSTPPNPLPPSVPLPPSPPPPPPMPPFSSLFIPETVPGSAGSAGFGAGPSPVSGPLPGPNPGPNPGPVQQPFPNHLGNVVGGAISSRVVDFCGPVGRPFIFDSRPVGCSMNDSLSCPPGFACTIYLPFNASFCCRSAPPSESHLPYEPTSQATAPATTPSPTPTQSPTVGSTLGNGVSTPFKPLPPSSHSVCGQWGTPYTFDSYPVTCVIHGQNSTCPQDYVCQFHPPSTAHFCCRVPDFGAAWTNSSPVSTSTANPTQTSSQPFIAISNPDGCPSQTYAARDHNGVIQVCDLLLAPDSCPTGTGCLYSALFGRYQCCGARLERWPQQTQSTTTTISTSSAFFTPPPPPSTPSVNSTKKPSNTGSSKPEECPPGQVAYKDPSVNETSACAANHADSCPGGYFCQWSQGSGKFLCCGVSAGCPNHGVAYVSAATWEVQRCGPLDQASTCPPGYSCQLALDGSHVCCANAVARPPPGSPSLPANPNPLPPIDLPNGNTIGIIPPPPSHLCPVGLPLNDQQAGGYRTCSEAATCPSGYQCVPSSVGTLCCPVYQGKTPPLWFFHSPVNTGAARIKV